MRILYSLEVFFPHISGVTVVTDRLASYFASKGNQVFIATASDKGDFLIEETLKGYTLIKLKSYPSPLGQKTKVSYFAQLKSKQIFDNYHPELIHLQDPLFISLALAQEARERNVPVVITQHNSLMFPLAYLGLNKVITKNSKIISLYYKNFFEKFCDLIIVPSHFIEEEINQLGVKIPIKVISNGVDIKFIDSIRITEEFLERYQLKDILNYPIVLYVGRLSKEKNLDIFPKIAEKVLKEEEVYFLFVGEGKLKEKLIKEFEKLKILKNTRFFSSVGQEDVYRFYKISTCLVLPSYLEAQSLVALEAMASGLPIIGANGGALKELINDKENGFLVDPFRPEDFSRAILEILKNRSLLISFKEKNKKLIPAHDIQKTLQEIEKNYQLLVKK